MLSYLSIRNFGIFSKVDLELAPGLSVFTGETGAGKSMIVDAVMACLGQRTPRDLIRSGEDRAVLELMALPPEAVSGDDAVFQLLDGEDEVILRKDILPDRSYLRVNGRLATQSAVQDLGARLVDIHGQQEHHSLLRPQNYLGMLDELHRDVLLPARDAFGALYRERQDILRRMSDLGKGQREREREIDLLSFQVDEIDRANLRPDEEEELRQEYAVLSAQEKLIELYAQAYSALYEGSGRSRAAYDLIDEALASFRKIHAVDPASSEALDSLEQVSFGLEAALDLMRQYRRGLAADPDRLKITSERLDLLQRLKSKYGESVEAIREFRDRAKSRLDELVNADETLERLKDMLSSVESKMAEAGAFLTEKRNEIARDMSENVTLVVRELGMPGAVFSAELAREAEPHPAGFDRVSFMFTANAGESPMPVHKVASGGELSRLMLAIKSFMKSADPVPTLIFDEIDAGIGGKAGQAVADKLYSLGKTHQVLCVTHLASIAAAADHHFLVSKHEKDGRTFASVRLLTEDERVPEIARMLSGADRGISLDHARELLRTTRLRNSS